MGVMAGKLFLCPCFGEDTAHRHLSFSSIFELTAKTNHKPGQIQACKEPSKSGSLPKSTCCKSRERCTGKSKSTSPKCEDL